MTPRGVRIPRGVTIACPTCGRRDRLEALTAGELQADGPEAFYCWHCDQAQPGELTEADFTALLTSYGIACLPGERLLLVWRAAYRDALDQAQGFEEQAEQEGKPDPRPPLDLAVLTGALHDGLLRALARERGEQSND